MKAGIASSRSSLDQFKGLKHAPWLTLWPRNKHGGQTVLCVSAAQTGALDRVNTPMFVANQIKLINNT